MSSTITTRIQTAVILALAILLALPGCKKDEEPEAAQANRAPNEFTVTTAPDLNSVLISWTTATDPDGDTVSYMVVLGEDTLTEGLEQTFHEVMDLQYETGYSGSVIASDPIGAERNADFSFTTGIYPNAAPMAFDLTGPGNGSTNVSDPINFNWNDAIDSDGDMISYELLFDQNVQPITSIAADLEVSSYSYTIELGNGQTYYWQVIARDGNGGETLSEVFSFTSLTTMTLGTDEPGWGARANHTVTSFNGKLWLIGGIVGAGTHLTDIWSSSDGINWTEEFETAPWGARAHHAAVVYDNKLWVVGGQNFYTAGSELNDVWYTEDGTNWVEVTSSASFEPRRGIRMLSYDG